MSTHQIAFADQPVVLSAPRTYQAGSSSQRARSRLEYARQDAVRTDIGTNATTALSGQHVSNGST